MILNVKDDNMKLTFLNGLKTYGLLFDTKNYKTYEFIIKWLLSPFLLILNTALFIIVMALYTIERLLAHVFRLFIKVQTKLYRRKMLTKNQNIRPLLTFFAVIVFFLFFPFLLTYYLSMILKLLFKYFMRKLIMLVDFTKHYTRLDLMIFDDVDPQKMQAMQAGGLFQDLNQTEALGSALESFFSQMHDDETTNKH